MDKPLLRKALLEKRSTITYEARECWSAEIIDRVLELPEYLKANQVLLYHPSSFEVDTTELLKDVLRYKKLYLPRLIEGNHFEARECQALDELVLNKYEIREPSADMPLAEALDLVIIPGVAFDETGGRLGMGKGYYDRFLSTNKALIKVAVAYEQQILDAVPKEPYDEPVDIIVTEKRVIRCSN